MLSSMLPYPRTWSTKGDCVKRKFHYQALLLNPVSNFGKLTSHRVLGVLCTVYLGSVLWQSKMLQLIFPQLWSFG